MPILADAALDQLFRSARTHNGWQADRPIDDATLHALYELWKWGPTQANCCPARVIFVRSPEAKEKLRPCMAPGNLDKTMAAPATAIIGMDLAFYEAMPKLFPHAPDARSWFAGNDAAIHDAAWRNSSLQAGYLIVAARALGLDCGPMAGFDAEKINAAFFAGTEVKVNFLCNLGYGDPAKLRPRGPRLNFEEACRVV